MESVLTNVMLWWIVQTSTNFFYLVVISIREGFVLLLVLNFLEELVDSTT